MLTDEANYRWWLQMLTTDAEYWYWLLRTAYAVCWGWLLLLNAYVYYQDSCFWLLMLTVHEVGYCRNDTPVPNVLSLKILLDFSLSGVLMLTADVYCWCWLLMLNAICSYWCWLMMLTIDTDYWYLLLMLTAYADCFLSWCWLLMLEMMLKTDD